MNCYTEDERQAAAERFRLDPALEAQQCERLARWRESRDADAVTSALERLDAAARSTTPLLPPLKDALAAGATLGETCDVLRAVFGQYRPGN